MGQWIEIAGAPVLAGLRFRPFAGAGDYPAMAKLLNDVLVSEGEEPFLMVNMLEQMDASIADFDPQRDRLIVEIDGEMIGVGRVQAQRTVAGERVYYHSFSLAPAWRGHGISGAVLRYHEQRLRQMAAEHPHDGPRFFQTFPLNDANPCAGELLRGAGYAPYRFSCRMVRPHLDDVPDVKLPAGIEIRPVRDEDVRAIWDAKEEAFEDLPGYARASEEAFEQFAKDPYWRKDLTCITWEGDRVVGTVFVFIADNQPTQAWTELISVRRPWRRRGIARAMMAECLRRLKAGGLATAVLGVDTENPSGAHRLYEAMGYRVTHRATVYRKAVT